MLPTSSVWYRKLGSRKLQSATEIKLSHLSSFGPFCSLIQLYNESVSRSNIPASFNDLCTGHKAYWLKSVHIFCRSSNKITYDFIIASDMRTSFHSPRISVLSLTVVSCKCILLEVTANEPFMCTGKPYRIGRGRKQNSSPPASGSQFSAVDRLTGSNLPASIFLSFAATPPTGVNPNSVCCLAMTNELPLPIQCAVSQ